MTAQSRATLQAEAVLVRDETVTAANTAIRVGSTLLDLVDSMALGAVEISVTLNADQNNWAPASFANLFDATAQGFLKATPATTTRTVTGIAAPATGPGGAIRNAFTLINVGSQNLVLSHQSGSSSEANRIISPTGSDLTIAPNESATLWYDFTAQRWYVTSRSAAGGVGGAGDIEAVIAGTLLSGGGTSGTVTLNIADLVGLSVIGRSASSTGAPAAIVAASDGQVLRRSGTALGFGAIDLASASAVTGDLPFASIAQLAGTSVLGRSANSLGDLAAITAATDGHVLRRSGTTLGFGLVTDINVDAAAAIAGTKISPNFGAQNILTTGSIVLGATPAAAGRVRLTLGDTLTWRNRTGGDTIMVSLTDTLSLNVALFGGGVSGDLADISILTAASEVGLELSGTSRFVVTAADATLIVETLQFDSGVANPTIRQADEPANSATGDTLIVQAQNATGTTSTGGALELASGEGTSENGTLSLICGTDAVITLSSTLALVAEPLECNAVYAGLIHSGLDRGLRTDRPSPTQTTDATETTIYTFSPPTDTRMHFSAIVVVNSSTESAVWRVEAFAFNNSGTTAFVGTPTVTQTFASGSFPAATLAVDVSGAAVRLRATGVVSTTINWFPFVQQAYS